MGAVSHRFNLKNIIIIISAQKGREWEVEKAHNAELHSLYRSPKLIWMIKSRRLRWAEHVARMADGRIAFKILLVKAIGKIFWKS